tara:strand:+ start:1777 stop:1923 length:147 start_codon:yes stop_codon:yes gene_type:complete
MNNMTNIEMLENPNLKNREVLIMGINPEIVAIGLLALLVSFSVLSRIL